MGLFISLINDGNPQLTKYISLSQNPKSLLLSFSILKKCFFLSKRKQASMTLFTSCAHALNKISKFSGESVLGVGGWGLCAIVPIMPIMPIMKRLRYDLQISNCGDSKIVLLK